MITLKKKVLRAVFTVSILLNLALVTATAMGNRELIQAWLCPDVSMEWNGVEFSPTEDNGERVYPIIYNDRTYLPVRYVAEKAGVSVGWDADTNTVQLGTNGYVYEQPVNNENEVDYGNIQTNVFDFSFLGNSLSPLKGKLVLDQFYNQYLDSNGYWIAQDWSTSMEKSYIFPVLHFIPSDTNDKVSVGQGFDLMCTAIENNGFTLVKVDDNGKRHYVSGNTEINIWDIGNLHTALAVDIKTGYQACCL